MAVLSSQSNPRINISSRITLVVKMNGIIKPSDSISAATFGKTMLFVNLRSIHKGLTLNENTSL